MKKILLAFLISASAFAQTDNFHVEKSRLFWKTKIDDPIADYIKKAENNPKLEISRSTDSQFRGIAKNLKCDCPGTSIFIREEFDADFIVYADEVGVRISLFNLRFKNSTNLKVYGVTTNVESDPAEKYFVKKDGTLRTSNLMVKNLGCLDKYFSDILKL